MLLIVNMICFTCRFEVGHLSKDISNTLYMQYCSLVLLISSPIAVVIKCFGVKAHVALVKSPLFWYITLMLTLISGKIWPLSCCSLHALICTPTDEPNPVSNPNYCNLRAIGFCCCVAAQTIPDPAARWFCILSHVKTFSRSIVSVSPRGTWGTWGTQSFILEDTCSVPTTYPCEY